MTAYRKKLIEVALPLEAINVASAREKSIRHGHPSTLHLWWARRPLAACRAVLFAQLVDDPDDDPMFAGDADLAATKRAELFNLIEELVQWENSNNPRVIGRARAEIARCVATRGIDEKRFARDAVLKLPRPVPDWQRSRSPLPPGDGQGEGASEPATMEVKVFDIRQMLARPEQVNAFLAEYAPPVLDPFAGGGSIPLEAQRLGLRAHASDLNPVPVLINKALIEIPPKFAGMPPVNPEARSEWRGERSEAEEERREEREVRKEVDAPTLTPHSSSLAPSSLTTSTAQRSKGDALSGDGSLAEGDGGGEGVVSAGAAPAEGGDVRDAVANHPGGRIGSGECGRGMDAGDRPRQGQLPGDCPGEPRRDGNTADSVRGSGLVPHHGDRDAPRAVGRSQPHAHVNAPPVSDKVRKELRGVRKAADAPTLTPHSSSFTPSPTTHSSLLFPRSYHGAQGLADDVRYYGRWMRDEAEKRIGHLYPKVKVTKEMAKDRPDLKTYVGQELTVIAWLWARTVKSSNPACANVHVPLASSFWLSKKTGKEAWVEPILEGERSTYRFVVRTGKPPKDKTTLVSSGTKLGRGCKFRCILSDQPIPETHVKREASEGRMGARLMAIVAEGTRGRVYLTPGDQDEKVVAKAQPQSLDGLQAPLANDPRNLWCLAYGLDTFDKLFTPRQLTALTTFSDLVGEARAKVLADTTAADGVSADARPLAEGGTGPQAYADAVATYLAFAANKCADYWNTIATWMPRGTVGHALNKQAIPMTWDYPEANPLADFHCAWHEAYNWVAKAVCELPAAVHAGSVQQVDVVAAMSACANPMVATDPPYYDNIGYADLSDFFYVWLRRSLRVAYSQLLSTMLTPKAQEMIASPYRHGGSKAKAATFFEEGLGKAIGQWRKHGCLDYPTTVFYAFKQAETDSAGTASTGWETFLAGVIEHGFAITGTWPLRTERSVRSVAIGTNALASSVVLACVPREPNAPMATRREFLNALKRELPDAMKKLQSGNIAPVDLAQAAIGPGMAVFSRYSKVVESDGAAMSVRTALTLINQSLDEVLAEQEGEFDADTRWAVAWFEQHGTQEGPFGVAETLSKAKNTSVAGLVEAGVVAARGGKVKLLGRDAMPDGWDPAADKRPTCWEAAQHLIRRLQTQGEPAAAALLARLGADYGETARDLAYRLYSICERKKWADEALAYNGLVIAWPELVKLALRGRERQEGLFE